MLILLERSVNYKIELKMSTSLSSSFSSSKTNQIKSLKIAMSSSISSSFFNNSFFCCSLLIEEIVFSACLLKQLPIFPLTDIIIFLFLLIIYY